MWSQQFGCLRDLIRRLLYIIFFLSRDLNKTLYYIVFYCTTLHQVEGQMLSNEAN